MTRAKEKPRNNYEMFFFLYYNIKNMKSRSITWELTLESSTTQNHGKQKQAVRATVARMSTAIGHTFLPTNSLQSL